MRERRFIAGPVLAGVVDTLAQRVRDGVWDLSRLIIVTPGSRAGRVLVSMLAERAADLGVPLEPPLTITPSELPGSVLVLLEARHGPIGAGWRAKPPASALVRQSLWIRALRGQTHETLSAIAAIEIAPDEARPWSALANVIARSADDLAAAGLRLRDAAARSIELGDFAGQDRVEAAARVQDAYEALLDESGLSDPAIQAIDGVDAWEIRLNSTPHAGGAAAAIEIMLVAVVQLGRVARRACRLPGVKTSAIVPGPREWAPYFDDLGCILTAEEHAAITAADLVAHANARWIPADAIWVAEDPREQAAKALAALAQLSQDATVAVHDVIFGVPDASVAFHLEREGRRAGVRVRGGIAVQVSHTEAYRACEALIEHAKDRTLLSMRSALLRPRIESWIAARIRESMTPATPNDIRAAAARGLLDAIDRYAERAVHSSLEVGFHAAKPDIRWLLESARDLLDQLVGPMHSASRDTHAASALLRALAAIYRDAAFDATSSPGLRREVAAARILAEGLREAAMEHAEAFAPSANDQNRPDPIAALQLALSVLGDSPLAEDPESDSIECLGWLELLLDPAPTLILTGMNAGLIPSTSTPDPLLPEALRRLLDMEHAGTRAARDRVLFAAMLACKPRVIAVLGRRDEAGGALMPSPVLLPGDGASLTSLYERFTREGSGDTPSQRVRAACVRPRRLLTPPPRPLPTPWIDAPLPTHLSVTALREYLQSPYLFYLHHVLGLDEVDAPVTRLDPASMGSLLHRTLEVLFREGRDLTDDRAIETLLMDELSTLASGIAIAQERRGTNGPLLRLQIESVRARLRAAAIVQADARRQGWRILAREVSLDGGLVISPEPGAPPLPILRGKIDRIDTNDAGEIRVIDYKTGDTPHSPEEMHVKGGAWIDLQLPLYRHMACAIVDGRTFATLHESTPERPIRLGYFNLCADPGQVAICDAEWTGDALAGADQVARAVLHAIARREFEEVAGATTQFGATGALASWAQETRAAQHPGGHP